MRCHIIRILVGISTGYRADADAPERPLSQGTPDTSGSEEESSVEVKPSNPSPNSSIEIVESGFSTFREFGDTNVTYGIVVRNLHQELTTHRSTWPCRFWTAKEPFSGQRRHTLTGSVLGRKG